MLGAGQSFPPHGPNPTLKLPMAPVSCRLQLPAGPDNSRNLPFETGPSGTIQDYPGLSGSEIIFSGIRNFLHQLTSPNISY